MKTIGQLLLLSFWTLLFSSCTKLFLYSQGIRNPRIETETSILNYLKANGLNTNNCFALRDTFALNSFFESKIGTPEIRFYDKNGYLMQYRDEKRCNGQNDSLIEFLNPVNIIRVDSTQNIFNYLNEIRTLKGQTVNPDDFKNFDFYLITYWTKWMGKVNKNKIGDWENSLQKPNSKIKSIKITCDYMDFWSISKKDMFKIYSRKTKTSGIHHKK
ncbi:MAG: hypothetical protein ACJ77K_14435 [Bacteroidia bacterium]